MQYQLPFKYGKHVNSSFFVNRREDIDYLSKIILSKINITLISPRRWGKSSLVLKVAEEVKHNNKNIKFCFIDLYKTRNEKEFYEYFTSEVIKCSSSKWEEWIDHTKYFFKKIIPKFSLGVDPTQDFSISLDWNEVQKNPDEILNLPENISKKKNIHLVICLDEFQNIAHFKDTLGFQKRLRAVWQTHQECSYVIYGSKQHMMTEIFEKKSMPFYKFGEVLFLKKIETSHWKKYIVSRFKKTKKKITAKLAEQIAVWVENHPYFVQQLANSVWMETTDICTPEIVTKGLDNLLNQYDLLYSREIDNLSNLQLNLLKAIALGEKRLSTKEVIKKYNLSSSATVSRSKKGLIQKEIIDTFTRKIEFLDPLFKLWFIKQYLNKEI